MFMRSVYFQIWLCGEYQIKLGLANYRGYLLSFLNCKKCLEALFNNKSINLPYFVVNKCLLYTTIFDIKYNVFVFNPKFNNPLPMSISINTGPVTLPLTVASASFFVLVMGIVSLIFQIIHNFGFQLLACAWSWS